MKNSDKLKSLYYDIYSKKLLIVGAINYLLMGLIDLNIIEIIGNNTHTIISIIIYLLIGIAGLYQIGVNVG